MKKLISLSVFCCVMGCNSLRHTTTVLPDRVEVGCIKVHDGADTSKVIRTDYFITHYDGTGALNWTEIISGGTKGNTLTDACIGDNHSTYILGWFSDSICFDSFHLKSHGLRDVFFAKLNNAGHCLWALSYGDKYDDACTTITANMTPGKCSIYVFLDANWHDFNSVCEEGADDGYPTVRTGIHKQVMFDAVSGTPE